MSEAGSVRGRRRKKKHHRRGEGGAGGSSSSSALNPGSAMLVVPSKQGWLTKRGAVIKNWKRRWVVCKDGAIAYYVEPASGGNAKGEFPLTDAIAQPCAVRIGKQHAFEVITRSRTYYFIAENDTEMREWIDVVQRNITTVRSTGEVSAADYVGGKEVYVKILVVGDSSVGKTQLARRWNGDSFQSKYKETEGTPFMRSKISYDGWLAHLCVYDIPGSTRMLDHHWRGVAAIIACFDVSNHTSYGKAKKICRDVVDNHPRCVPIIVGTKTDLDANRVVEEDTAETFAHESGGVYVECSARQNKDCDQPFFHVLKAMSTLNRWAELPVSADAVL